MKNNRESVLKSIVNSEDRLAAAKLLNKAEFTARTHRLAHSDFLDPRQAKLAERALKAADIYDYCFYGGFSGAERSVALFKTCFTDEAELEQYKSSILKVIEIDPLMRNSLNHRDYLGALMGLGIRRSVIGDIIIDETKCNVIVLSDIADYIERNLHKVGNIGIDLKISDIIGLSVPAPETAEVRAVVSALRLDCVCAAAFGLSRSKTSEYIKSGRVQLNWEITTGADKPVREGDTLSMRGKGRAVLGKDAGRTRKDRISVIITKYM